MKLTLAIFALVASTAFARTTPPTVDEMTCEQAQKYAVKNGHYFKKSFDQVVPIYPIVPSATALKCPTRSFAAPEVEETLDNPQCILTWYCHVAI